ncbi:hypothetical protein CBP51_06615 [Cellvibrio mixtus]|uniref:Nickel transporter n=1 Tax=Cellvibrio mixtus TaxID=39650 RepID=A0A266Q9V6_9GAMM|nr:DUF4198 domain-containing protein [Cellvibrio mixtus]OZY86683.1 hypothetical protein CBP51_06615 [Cellvibrio mixtus]
MKTLLSIALPFLYLCVLGAPVVHAHTPFIAPVAFEPAHQGWISLDAGFAETFFHSDVAFDKGHFQVLTPAGTWVAPARVEQFTSRSVLEYQAQQEGTYRFTTGTRLGAVFRMYELNGERKHTRDPKEVLPKGHKLLDHYQSVTLAETYVTLKAPTTAAFKPYNKGLELVPITHPNDLYAGELFEFSVLLDGNPLVEQPVSIFSAQDATQQQQPVLTATTDRQGKASITLNSPGVYLLHLRKSAPAPKGAEAPHYGYIYTLSFAMQPEL